MLNSLDVHVYSIMYFIRNVLDRRGKRVVFTEKLLKNCYFTLKGHFRTVSESPLKMRYDERFRLFTKVVTTIRTRRRRIAKRT